MNVLDRLDRLCTEAVEHGEGSAVDVSNEHLRALLDVARAAQSARTNIGLTVYEGTPVSVWSGKEIEKSLGAALAPLLEDADA